MKVSFGGIGERVVTFYNRATGGAAAGDPVKMSGDGEVCACGDGDRFFGLALSADSDFAAVQTGGAVTAVYSGAAPSAGWRRLAADGAGGVRLDPGTSVTYADTGDVEHTVITYAGGEYLVLETDSANGAVTFIV